MKNTQDYEKDLAAIRSLMERSVKFASLSGVSGVIAGVYALAGAVIAYMLIYAPDVPAGYPAAPVRAELLHKLILVAALVLIFSVTTAYVLSLRKARSKGANIWNGTSQKMLVAMAIPLATGGLFVINLLWQAHYELVASCCLIFYGLSLLNASFYTYNEIRYLGFFEILIGLVAAVFPGYGLVAWALGFGVLHVVYGWVMYYRYDR